MQTLIIRMLKEQNRRLILQIAQDYNRCPDELMKKFWTPAYYLPVWEAPILGNAQKTDDALFKGTAQPEPENHVAHLVR